MDNKDYREKNRAAWNQAAPVHRQQRSLDLHAAVRQPGFNVLDDVARRILGEIGVQGKRVAQLCCNNGRELISACNMGAAGGVGFDISDAFITEARELTALSGAPCEFERSDVLEIPDAYNGGFDLAWMTIGALTWIEDLGALFAVCSRLVKPGGILFLYEMHPVLDMLSTPEDEEYDPQDELKIVFPYFSHEPWVSSDGLDYIGKTTYESAESVCFPHSLSEIFTQVLRSGFRLRAFEEYAHDISAAFAHLEKYGKIPMCYTLVAEKPGHTD